MADENINFEVTGFQNFRAQIKEAQVEYQKLLADVNASPAAIAAAATKVGQLKDQMGDAADSAAALGTTAGKFGAITKGVASLSGGFTALQGAIGLAGGDAKSFEKTMQKVQSAMALTQGLTALADLGDAFNNMKTVGVNAFKAIKGAIGATGIGLLLVALGTIVAYWDDITAAVSGVSAEQEALNAETAANAAASQENLDALTASEEQLKLSGLSEKEIYDLKIKQYDATIKDAEAKQAADEATLNAQVAAAQRNKDILKGVLDFISLPLTLVLETIDQIGLAFGKDFGLREGFKESVANMIFDPAEVKSEGEKTLKTSADALNKIKEQRAGLINAQNDKEKAAATAKQKEITDQAAKDAAELAKITADAAFEANKLGKSELEKQNIDIEEKYRERLAIVKKESQAEKDLLALKQAELDAAKKDADKKAEDLEKEKQAKEKQAQEEALANKEKALDSQYNLLEADAIKQITNQEDLDKALLNLEIKKIKDQIALKKQYGEDTTELELQLAEKIKEIGDKEEEDAKARNERIKEERQAQIQGAIEAATAIFNAVNAVQEAQKQREIEALKEKGLSQEEAAKQTDEINKKYFEKNKGVQIGQAIIQTLQSSISAFSSLAAIPVVGPALGAVAAAAALVTGYATVDKIRNTSYVSSAKPEAGGGSAPGSSGSKFADGGMLQGPSHGMGGIKTAMGELEGGEFVINKRSTANFLPLIQAINDQASANASSSAANAPAPIFKTYVVASEMSSTQEADKRVSDIARL